MSRPIDRDEAIRRITGYNGVVDKSVAKRILLQMPDAERKKGKWEYHSNPNIRGGMNPEDAYCSVCGFHVCTSEVDDFDNYNFCPNCGADCRGGQDD